MSNGRLILIPSALSEDRPEAFMPQASLEEVRALTYFIAERAKTARHFLKTLGLTKPIQELEISELNKHGQDDYAALLSPCLKGYDVGLLSEAGAPGVADPGGGVVSAAHMYGVKVVPLVGPSSILLALMASGFNGQQFAFHGYLAKDGRELAKELIHLENDSRRNHRTQLFIETPFRNGKLIEVLLKTLHPETELSIATDVTSNREEIRTKSISAWKKGVPKIEKRPTVFSIYAGEKVK